MMEKSVQIKVKLRAKITKWTAEETEHWFCGSAHNEGDLNDYLETLDMVVSDLKEHIPDGFMAAYSPKTGTDLL